MSYWLNCQSRFQSKACPTADLRDAREEQVERAPAGDDRERPLSQLKTEKEDREPVLLLHGVIWMGHMELVKPACNRPEAAASTQRTEMKNCSSPEPNPGRAREAPSYPVGFHLRGKKSPPCAR